MSPPARHPLHSLLPRSLSLGATIADFRAVRQPELTARQLELTARAAAGP